uniref:ABC transporter domain-containing protein n=1 Tax=Alexandrium monilatum TaxID=311494 RepID=A0A7S4T3F1_9DINO|mmetsp:Transcript_1383/g.4479  ORF Transcript_1383/g.4479 Transcript_1383/m.4479 type:complete len:711 (+) Transcript_1383:111-2243(+)
MAADDASAVRVDGLSFSMFPGGPELLRDVSLRLPAGARCVLIGANGAGKSTLLELIAGKKMAPAGCVKVLDGDPFRGPSGQKVALVQGVLRTAGEPLGEGSGALVRVWQALGLGDPGASEAAPAGEPGPCGDSRMQELLDLFGLGRLLLRYCGSLSDGERRRLELARKLRDRRPVLLLDEATTDLDLLIREKLLGFLRADGSTVVNVTHVFDGLEAWATHVLQMHEGRLVRCEAVPPEGGDRPWGADGGLFPMAANWISAASTGATPPPPPPPAAPPAADGGATPVTDGPAVQVKDLAFAYAPWAPVALRLDELALPRGCRCVLVGLNGCGKSTLLSVLAGRRLVAQPAVVHVLGQRAFHDHAKLDPQIAILSTEWKKQVAEMSAARAMSFKDLASAALQALVAAGHDMAHLAGRMVRLTQMLGIDPTKPLGLLSDGMMRRAQIALKLLCPVRVLLVDEVTADLDVLSRRALLDFLREEAEAGCAVLYCTHILDGLEGWASSLLWVRPGGLTARLVSLESPPPAQAEGLPEGLPGGSSTALLRRVLSMLREDEGVEPAPLPEVPAPAAGGEDAALPSGWRDREATHAGAYGSYAWNADRGPQDAWSFGSVAPEPPKLHAGASASGPLPGAGGGGGAFGAGPLTAAPSTAFPGALGGHGAWTAAPGFGGPAAPAPLGAAPAPRAGDPFGFGSRGNSVPLQELIARGVVPPQ